MAKASPLIRAFNAGEFSKLMEGRSDLDRYPASLRTMLNYIAAPQGPAIPRSGTMFMFPNAKESTPSALLPFVFSSEQAKMLEFSDDRIRFMDEDGIQVYTPVAADVTSAAGAPIQMTATGMGAAIGDQVVLLGFPDSYNLNGEIAKITAKVGDNYTLDLNYPTGVTVVDGQAARVYHVACVYTVEEREALRFVQSIDVLYLLTGLSQPRKLSRYGDYDWRLENILFTDGPYMPTNETATTLTPSETGNAIPNMTSNTLPSGTCSGSGNRPAVTGTPGTPDNFLGRDLYYALDASQFYYAFDDSDTTYWADDKEQSSNGNSSYIQYQAAAGFVCNGYTIYAATDNQDTSYLAKDYAPSTFELQGSNNGSTWTTLDRQENYIVYDNNKSTFFEIENETSYSYYRLRIFKLVRNGLIEARVRRLVLRKASSTTFSLTASSVVGINNDQGFLPTDVGRLIRLKGSDNTWRSLRVTIYTSPTVVTVRLIGEPLLNLKPIKQWRLGYWSDTTGWPLTGDFFDDRLWLAGPEEFPDQFAGSVTGAYETFSQTDPSGAVLDDSAIVGRLNSRKLSRIRWLSSDSRGLVMGTGSEEYTLSAPSNEVLNARNAKARPATRRGSASVEPVRMDNQVLYVQRGMRTVREFAYVFESDGYRSPSMSQLASHLGAEKFVEMDYAAEPHSIVWIRRGDGTLVGLTSNRDENVVGWHRHDLSGAVIESLACLPQKDELQDALWMQVRRTVDGQTRRYIERLMPFWDFGFTFADHAHYVDCALRYDGVVTQKIYGLQHLEGQVVYGLVDGNPVGPLTVENGSVDLTFEGSKVVLGLGFDAECETSRLENGAADGTALGKVKRINGISLNVWDSQGGEVGVYDEDNKEVVWEPIEYPGDLSQFEELTPYSGELGPITPAPGYGKRGTVWFRRRKESPLPFNILSIMPQLNTQDR